MININFEQKFFEFSNLFELIDINDVNEIVINNEQRFVVIQIANDIKYFNFIYEKKKTQSSMWIDIFIIEMFLLLLTNWKIWKKKLLTHEYVNSLFFVCEIMFYYNISSKLIIWKKNCCETFRWSNDIEH